VSVGVVSAGDFNRVPQPEQGRDFLDSPTEVTHMDSDTIAQARKPLKTDLCQKGPILPLAVPLCGIERMPRQLCCSRITDIWALHLTGVGTRYGGGGVRATSGITSHDGR
jgi:hypothetical protein